MIKNTYLFILTLIFAIGFSPLKLQGQSVWESVVLEDAFGDDRTAQASVIQGNGAGNLYVKGIASGSGIRETFIKLSLNDLANLTSAELDYAKVELRLYTVRTNVDAAQNQISVYPITNDWSETTLTWTNSRTLSSNGLAAGVIGSGAGVKVAGYTGTGQQGQPTDAYNITNVSRFNISGYAIQQYKLGVRTISVMLRVVNTVNNGDQQLASKDLVDNGTVPDRTLKIPKLIVTQPLVTSEFMNPAIGFTNIPVQFNNGLATSYAWNFGDGTTSTAANPTHTYTASGTYNVTLTVNGNSELTTQKNITIHNINNETIVGGNMELTDKASWGIVGDNTFAIGGATWGSTSPTDFGTNGHLYLSEENGTGTQFYIWQAIRLVKDAVYTFSFDYTKSTYQKAWGEVYIGTTLPGNNDYSNGGSRGTKPISWLADLQSDGVFVPAQYSFNYTAPADGVYYFVLKVGTNGNGKFLFGLDNIKLEKVPVTTTSVDTKTQNSDYTVFVQDRKIVIKSASVFNKIDVYNAAGQLIVSDITNSEFYNSKVLPAGFYIVSVDNNAVKLILK